MPKHATMLLPAMAVAAAANLWPVSAHLVALPQLLAPQRSIPKISQELEAGHPAPNGRGSLPGLTEIQRPAGLVDPVSASAGRRAMTIVTTNLGIALLQKMLRVAVNKADLVVRPAAGRQKPTDKCAIGVPGAITVSGGPRVYTLSMLNLAGKLKQ